MSGHLLKKITKELEADTCTTCAGTGVTSRWDSGGYYGSSEKNKSSTCSSCEGLGKHYTVEQAEFIRAVFPYTSYNLLIESLKDRIEDLENSKSED